jgi:hypothetical protein
MEMLGQAAGSANVPADTESAVLDADRPALYELAVAHPEINCGPDQSFAGSCTEIGSV